MRRRERVASGTRRVAVGHVAHTLAGVVSWGASAEPGIPPLELKSLYVAAAYHGAGVAAALITHALDGHRKIEPDTGIGERRLVRT